MSYSDNEIRDTIAGNRLPTGNAMIQYRQMVALESIADSLRQLEGMMRMKFMSTIPSDGEELVVSPIDVGPALQHRRRRGAPEAG